MAEQVAKVKEGVRILPCTCEHADQDAMYGPHMRVHNVSKNGRACCTVCTPNYRIWRMDPADNDIPPSAVFGNMYINRRKSRDRGIKKVA